jgi:CDGSH-type Zn-finger protein
MLEDSNIKKIIIETNGPYVVQGSIPLVIKTQVVSEYGEPLTWKKEDTIPTDGTYCLCRCGRSAEKPFCDGTHDEAGFDGSETADTRPTSERQQVYPGATNIVVKRDYALCSESGFCGNRITKIKSMVANTSDPQVRAQIMAMIERCPSGSYTYSLAENTPDIEPDLPQQIAITTDIISTGPVPGALWVTGGIPIERSDGKPFETRNRVTLCTCGRSQTKPLCDGAHRQPVKPPGEAI